MEPGLMAATWSREHGSTRDEFRRRSAHVYWKECLVDRDPQTPSQYPFALSHRAGPPRIRMDNS
ncbi:uncharacterized protein A1O5_12301 [Cladophialophora psammophila CBS 110553]|uniref:Uncharacterized protein n=1 Tax=Cladophialophora psammophila CBS 110553 TaxID=1182543 RepID=W9W348_9EURO|nr:uncharacterized protein A1O5_12301 [Cladophialophora psammophila CBS 110553]EXJ59420.1 hypothetical protein A1O5_12301 [Cladophialophora psammophila CBS 110553]